MQVYYIGGDPALTDHSGTVTTDSACFDPNYSRCAIAVGTGMFVNIPVEPAVDLSTPDSSGGLWLHVMWQLERTYEHQHDLAQNIFCALDSSGNLVAESAGYRYSPAIRLYAPSGSVVSPNRSLLFLPSALTAYDFHFYTDDGGSRCLDLYENGALIEALTMPGEPLTDIASFRLGTSSESTTAGLGCFSELVVADFDTRHMRVATYVPTADGTYLDGTGDYTAVAEADPDGALLTLDTAPASHSVVLSPVGTFDLPGIIAAVAGGRVATSDGSSLEFGLRSTDGQESFSGPLAVGTVIAPHTHTWMRHNNPAWTGPMDLNGAELIVRAS
ncbi:MAG: hypothetical protein VBE63_08490 [Lamprobacter sp.]|uniref:hypothetical protein n=1 Tax=Lamprobacter sp. TaxID=3100796 RepID=UPI002B2578B0|nr:hypothetical protein [Lamprobacter sp.]MEA3639968.1 hypothetical protein [Lamprobacter sp.]